MKKTAWALALVLSAILILLVVEFQPAILVNGNFVWPRSYICITFPENDKTYYSSNLTLRYHAIFAGEQRKWIVYNLDGSENVTIVDEYGSPNDFNGSVTLSGLTAGQHYVEICAKNAIGMLPGVWGDIVDRVYFNVFASPHEYCVSLQSPQNGTTYSGPVLLNFTRFGHVPSTYTYFYALDGGSIKWGDPYVENIHYNWSEPNTLDPRWYEECETWGWAYLSNLTVGAHSLTFCSIRKGAVYGDFQTVYFNVMEPFPTTLVIISVIVVAVAGLSLLVYLKKRHR